MEPMFDEDPLNYVCRQIVDSLTCLAFAIYLILASQLIRAWCRVRIGCLVVCGWITTAWYHLQMISSHLYWKHIHVWLVVKGFQRELTWAEIEERPGGA